MRLVWDRIWNTGYSMVGVVWCGWGYYDVGQVGWGQYDVGGVVVGVWILCCGRGPGARWGLASEASFRQYGGAVAWRAKRVLDYYEERCGGYTTVFQNT